MNSIKFMNDTFCESATSTKKIPLQVHSKILDQKQSIIVKKPQFQEE
jgi:hypothetical protein